MLIITKYLLGIGKKRSIRRIYKDLLSLKQIKKKLEKLLECLIKALKLLYKYQIKVSNLVKESFNINYQAEKAKIWDKYWKMIKKIKKKNQSKIDFQG